MTNRHTKFYLDKVHGKLMGVCAGIADYIGVDVLWVRVAMVTLTVWTGGLTLPVYLAIGLLADARPRALYADSDEQRFWQGVRQSPARSARDIGASFRDIDRRLASVEAYYVSANPRLSAEIENLR